MDYCGQISGCGKLAGETENSSFGYRSKAQNELIKKLPGPNDCVGTELGDSGQKTNVGLSSDRSNIKAKPKVIGKKISPFLDVYEGPKCIENNVEVPFLRPRSKTEVPKCEIKPKDKDSQSHLLVKFNDRMKGKTSSVVNTDNKVQPYRSDSSRICQAQFAINSDRVIGLKGTSIITNSEV